MFSAIDKLRKKPAGERRRVAVLITGVIVALIVLVWLAVLVISGSFFPGGAGGGENVPASENSGITPPY